VIEKHKLFMLMAESMERMTGDMCIIEERTYAAHSSNMKALALIRIDPTGKEFIQFYHGSTGAR
jgi:hypothetical protein